LKIPQAAAKPGFAERLPVPPVQPMLAAAMPATPAMSPEDRHHLLAAQGWLELGNPREAAAELDRLTANAGVDPDVQELRWQINAKAKNWNACVEIGRALTQVAPDRAVSWIHYAYALHELKRTQEAFDVLAPIATSFPSDATIPYNLACYACQLGDLVGARDWLAQAFRLGNAKEIQRRASEDPDLAPLWPAEEA
jgi:predicted Zn-dependent protease